MTIGTKIIVRLISKFEEILSLVQPLMKLALHLCRAKALSLVHAVFVPFVNLFNPYLHHLQNGTVFM